jgi:hypothetical protein
MFATRWLSYFRAGLNPVVSAKTLPLYVKVEGGRAVEEIEAKIGSADQRPVIEEYSKPEICDYGTLSDLTRGAPPGHHADVPQGTTHDPIFS